ncbi:MAG: SDR family oxidoreductase [Rhodobacteraceae bacterium]|nr:SDR family oxidoreductase [Paracoccaceae bacterium]
MAYLENLFGVSGKTALVTGGSSGIGRMIATALVQAGAHVMIVSRKGDRCEAVAAELNALGATGSAEGFSGDVGSQDAITALVDAVKSRTDKLDVLFNNAGVSWGAPMADFPFDAWQKVMNINVAGLFTLTRELLPLLDASASDADPARVVNIGSVMGTVPVAEGAYSYAASKAAVHHLTKILADELAARRITVNAFAPGPFPSKMTAFATGSEEGAAKVSKNVPLGRIGCADDIAAATLFLCGRGGSYISGAILPIDGGMSAQNAIHLFGNL